MILNLDIKAKPCWLDEHLHPATVKNCKVKDEYIYFEVEGRSLTQFFSHDGIAPPYHALIYRLPLQDPGMPRHVYAPNSFSAPDSGEVLIGEGHQWGYDVYWIVLDIEWFKALPIEHDGLAARSCGLCLERRALRSCNE
jgi:hypothetical protein